MLKWTDYRTRGHLTALRPNVLLESIAISVRIRFQRGKQMQLIENEVLSGKTFTIDEKHFVNCRYTDCTVVYSSGDYAWNDTTFQNCKLNLAGSAQRTVTLLGTFGVLPPGGTTPPPVSNFGFPKKPNGAE